MTSKQPQSGNVVKRPSESSEHSNHIAGPRSLFTSWRCKILSPKLPQRQTPKYKRRTSEKKKRQTDGIREKMPKVASPKNVPQPENHKTRLYIKTDSNQQLKSKKQMLREPRFKLDRHAKFPKHQIENGQNFPFQYQQNNHYLAIWLRPTSEFQSTCKKTGGKNWRVHHDCHYHRGHFHLHCPARPCHGKHEQKIKTNVYICIYICITKENNDRKSLTNNTA